MVDSQFDVGIIGIGNAAHVHAMAIDEVTNARLVAGSCRTEPKGRTFATQYDCEWYPSAEALLEGADPDVVTLCTPSGAHLEPALAAFEHGVHVLVEKPLEISGERIDRMAAAAEKRDVRLGGIFQHRYNPVVQAVQQAAETGRFGDLAVANAYVPWWRDDEYYTGSWKGTKELDGGGALMNQSIHGVDVVQWLAASAMELDGDVNPVEEVMAYVGRTAHDDSLLEVEDTAVAILRYRDGTLGQLLGATSMYPGFLKRIQLSGRDGTAEIREDELVTWEFRESRPEDDETYERFDATETEGGAGSADPTAISYEHHAQNIRDFVRAVAADEPFMLDPSEARKSVDIIEAVYESAERNEPVRPD